jgi:hypothetical protein
MKKSSIYIIFVLVVVAAIVVGLAVRYVPSVVPYWQCSEVYKRYSKVEGVCASYIKDYRINDTLTVGVTLLEATDSAGWKYLLQAFNIPQEMIELEEIDVWTWKAFKNHPEEAYNLTVNDRQVEQSDLEIVSISMKNQDICVFHTQNEQEHNEVFNQKIESNF